MNPVLAAAMAWGLPCGLIPRDGVRRRRLHLKRSHTRHGRLVLPRLLERLPPEVALVRRDTRLCLWHRLELLRGELLLRRVHLLSGELLRLRGEGGLRLLGGEGAGVGRSLAHGGLGLHALLLEGLRLLEGLGLLLLLWRGLLRLLHLTVESRLLHHRLRQPLVQQRTVPHALRCSLTSQHSGE